MTALERIFQAAICTEALPAGATVVCGCGQSYTTGDKEPVRFGAIANHTIVHGCQCESASSFGGMIWANRHGIARFLRGMSAAVQEDAARLVEGLEPRIQVKARFLIQNHIDWQKDHACEECVGPRSEHEQLVTDGFQCYYHRALAALKEAK